MAMNGNGDRAHAMAERAANSVWLQITARVFSIASGVAVSVATILIVRLLDDIKELDKNIDTIGTEQAVQGEQIDRNQIDINSQDNRITGWWSVFVTKSQADRDNDHLNARIERMEQYLYRVQ